MKNCKIVLLATVLMLASLLSACAKDPKQETKSDSFDKIKERGYIVIGLDDTFAPMGFRDENGDLKGFDVELAKEFAEMNDLEVKFQAIDWSLKEKELDSGNIDAIWNGYSITEERLKKVLMSEPYLNNRQIIVVLSDSAYETKEDLKKGSIALQKESSAYQAVNADEGFMKDYKEELVQFDTNNEAFMDLETKRVDALVVDEVLARYYMKLKGEKSYRVLKDDFGKEEFAVGLRMGDSTLKSKLDAALKQMKEDGRYDKIKSIYLSDN